MDELTEALVEYLVLIIKKARFEKGGPGSGHWGHAGRPGSRGGSVSGVTAMSIRTGRTARERQAAARAAGAKEAEKGKAQKLAKRFPELYRDKIEAMISNRIEINRLREEAGRPVRQSIEQYTDKLFNEFGAEPLIITRPTRIRGVEEALAASERVLANARKGQF